MDYENNVRQFPPRYAQPDPLAPDQRKIIELLNKIIDPDDRLVAFAQYCVHHRDLELTDALLVEARGRQNEENTPEAWYAITVYDFLHDAPLRYRTLQEMIHHSSGVPRYYAMGLELIAHTDPASAEAREQCDRLSSILLDTSPRDKDMMAIVKLAQREIFGIAKEDVEERITFARHKRRFQTPRKKTFE